MDTILFSAKKRESFLESGKKFVRARIGITYSESEDENGHPIPLAPSELMAPPPKFTNSSRINPRGISYLYLSDCEKTAILEARAWIGQEVSIGYFEIECKLKCIDMSKDKNPLIPSWGGCEEKLSADKKEKAVWGAINSSFSEPIRAEEEKINYIPTQYLSELLKNNGYDGVIFKSSLNTGGHNIALFNPRNAVLREARGFQVDSITPSISECANPYKCK